MITKTETATPGAGRTSRHQSFTIVELLIVMAVIALLIGIMLPAGQAVKDMARRTSTSGAIHYLASGLEMFKSEAKLGGESIPSRWPTATLGSPYAPQAPNYVNFVGNGAQTLLWGLVGVDWLGTPGFTGPMNNGVGGLYEHDSNGQPVMERFGPFLDLSKVKIATPAQLQLQAEPGLHPDVPVILDTFSYPILYYLPEVGRTGVDAYDYSDNLELLYAMRANQPIADPSVFAEYIIDQRAIDVPPVVRPPHNRDSYLLISPGPDGWYGTRDDVTNFPFNPQPSPP
ncbi:MAG: prepilin-type N-terminal cleavage/methylation domain-containing protein [Phycisphaerae bacterium]|nr:prepilin-type N-terminal cleavage/methylation domain-containing protein [Phycisphaerae bacterium]